MSQLNQIQNIGFDWLVPGLRHELIVGLIKSLPKKLRRNFVPAPDYAVAALQDLSPIDKKGQSLTLTQALANKLFRMSGVKITAEDFDANSLPAHLHFSFAVIDNNGKTLAINSSLQKLKQQLQNKLEKTIEKVVTNEVEKKAIQTFALEHLPEVFTDKQNGFEVKAYPALKAAGKQVDISLFTTKSEAKQAHSKGLVQLIINNVPSPVKYLQDKLPNKSKLSLYFNPFGQINLLIEDMIKASVASLIKDKGGSGKVRSASAYQEVQEYVRMELNDRALQIANLVEKGLAVANKVQKHCKGSIALNMVSNIANIKQHLDKLVFKGFIYKTGLQGLPDWNRYLAALLQRCEKLKVDPNRDRLNQIEIDKAESALEHQIKSFENQHKNIEDLAIVAEMIEEFRISLFAQQLGTKYPISLKRINNKLQELENKS